MAENEISQTSADAAEYVLGTLDEVSARRVEAALADDSETAREIACWEQRLNVLALALAPVTPPDSVWRGVEHAIGTSAEPDAGAAPAGRASSAAPVKLWRGIAAAASLVAIALAVSLFTMQGVSRSDNDAVPAYASMLRDERTGSSWLITVEPGSHQMRVVAMGNYAVPEGKRLRVWIKPEGGPAQLIGRFPHSRGQYTMNVSDAVVRSLGHQAQIMVSMENSGHSTRRGPTGPILWQAPVSRRTG